MPLPKAPITIQVSPSTYLLMMKLIEQGVEYIAGNNIAFKAGVPAALDALFDAIVPVGPLKATIVAELRQLRDNGLTEANLINLNAGRELVLTC